MRAAPAFLLLLVLLPLVAAQATTTLVATDDGSGAGSAYRFEPRSLTVAPGATITLKDTGQEPHSVTPVEKGAFADTVLQPGGTATIVAPTTPGTYKFYCKFHASATADPATSMAGTLVVQSGTPAPSPAARSPGFGAPVALLALVAGLVLLGRRH